MPAHDVQPTGAPDYRDMRPAETTTMGDDATRAGNVPGGKAVRHAEAVFSTRAEAPCRQFDAYRSQCAPVVDVLPSDDAKAGYDARFEMWKLGAMAIRRISTPAGQFLRHPAQLRRDGLDHWVIGVLQSGQEDITSGDIDIRVGTNAPTVFSLAAPMEVRRTAVEWTGLFIPRGVVPKLDARFHHLDRVVIDNVQGRLVGQYLAALLGELPSAADIDLAACAETTAAMLGTLARPEAAPADLDGAAWDRPRLAYLRRIIDQNLTSWSLSPRRLAKAAGVSRTTLYRLFDPYGGVSNYIQRERLRRAHQIIAGPRHRLIKDVATELCFTDASAFARAFRREFGYTATELQSGERSTAKPCAAGSTRKAVSHSAWAMLYE